MSADLAQIVAAGARAPVGTTAEGVAAAVRAGLSRVQLLEFPELGGGSSFVALDGFLDAEVKSGPLRMEELGRAALMELLEKLAPVALTAEVPVIVGLPEERPGWEPADLRQVCGALGTVPSGDLRLRIEPRPLGHAAALDGLREAVSRLDRHRCPIVFVGGVESHLDLETLAWLREHGQWLGDDARTGFAPGEAAAFVAVMHGAEARRLGLTSLAGVRAVAAARETKLIKTDAVNLGEGLTAVVSKALEGVADPVDDLHCDLNGERYRSEEWGFVALRLGAAFRDPSAYHTPVRSCGDVGAATGALNLVASVQAWRRRHARGSRALIWGSSEGGLRAAALLERPTSDRGGPRWAR